MGKRSLLSKAPFVFFDRFTNRALPLAERAEASVCTPVWLDRLANRKRAQSYPLFAP